MLGSYQAKLNMLPSVLDCKPSANLVNTHMFTLLVIDRDNFYIDDSDKNILTIALLGN